LVADWVGLQESADFGAVVSGAIVIQATLAVKPPAGEIVWIADDADGPALAVRAFLGLLFAKRLVTIVFFR